MKLPVIEDEGGAPVRAPMHRSGPVMQIVRVYRAEAAHHLPGLPPQHKCSQLHGHSYRIEVEVSAQCDDLGWVCDFARIDVAWEAVGARLDHNYLNEIEGLENPTSENVARWLFRRLSVCFSGDLRLSRVTVCETERSGATCTGVEPC